MRKKTGGQKIMKEIKYVEVNGILYPELKLAPQKEIHLSRFGRMKLKHLKEHKRITYTNLLVSGEFFNCLQTFDDEMNKLYDRLIEQYKVKWNITEELKEKDQMKWVREMYDTKNFAEEMLMDEYMYLILI